MDFKVIKRMFIPEFPTPPGEKQGSQLFHYERIWRWAVIASVGVSFIPLVVLTVWNLFQYQKALKAEIVFPVHNLVANTQRSLSLFLDQRKSALKFIALDNTLEELSNQARLEEVFSNLKAALGDIVDMGVITSDGTQTAYVGPYKLLGVNYEQGHWFKEVLIRDVYVSDVFLGYRDFPHIVIAVKRDIGNSNFFVLRATLDTKKFNGIVDALNVRPGSDAFLVNAEGVIQTPSRLHGQVLEKSPVAVPQASPQSEIAEIKDVDGNPVIIGYTRIEGSPFTFVVVKQPRELWRNLETFLVQLLGFLIVSSFVILFVILRISTIMVENMQEADRKRIKILHEIEYTAKMASVGRLAAGVAHEINNPLAIINEKAGLIKDLLKATPELSNQEKLIRIADSILNSVKRCSTITYRLLGFARRIDVQTELIDLRSLMEEVLSFLGKEAEFRNIQVTLKAEEELPPIQSDRGQLQQVFINILNNALAAVSDGGCVEVTIARAGPDTVSLVVEDNGVGIPKKDLSRIFDPFFTTKGSKGTGLGLSITYGIVQKLRGKIEVRSEVGKGTTFTVTLPLERGM